MQIKLSLLVAALAVATTAMPAKTNAFANAPTKALGHRSSPAKDGDSGIDSKYLGRSYDDTSKDLKASIENAWDKLTAAAKSKNHDKGKSSRSAKNPEDKAIQKLEFEWNSLTGEDKISMSDFFNHFEDNLDAAIAKAAKVAEQAAEQVAEKFEKINLDD